MDKFSKIILTIAFIVFITIVGLLIVDTYKDLTYNITTAEVNINYKEEIKPSYKYLKSITVYIIGSTPSEILEDDTTIIGKSWIGTGSIIKIDEKYTYILTNAHVAGDKNEGTVLFVDNGLQKVEAEILAFHKNTNVIDLAVIKVRGKLKDKRAVNGFASAYLQDKVYLVGNYQGIKYVYSEGCMAGYDSIYNIFQLPICYGNSGSAVIDKEGNLVGVVFAGYRVGWFGIDTTKAICVSSLSIQLFLESLGLN